MTKNAFALTFRGDYVGSWTSVYNEQHVVLVYPSVNHTTPKVAERFMTLASCLKAVKDDKARSREFSRFHQWSTQAFIVRVTPGQHDLVDLDTWSKEGLAL